MTRKTKAPIVLYSALADATRCRIIEILAAGPIPVHRLADAFSISRPAISRHLRVLKQAGLVAEVKKGRENLYAFRAQKIGKAIEWLETISDRPPNAPAEDAPAAAPVEEPIVLPTPVLDLMQSDAEKTSRIVRPKNTVAVSQMGFDF